MNDDVMRMQAHGTVIKSEEKDVHPIYIYEGGGLRQASKMC